MGPRTSTTKTQRRIRRGHARGLVIPSTTWTPITAGTNGQGLYGSGGRPWVRFLAPHGPQYLLTGPSTISGGGPKTKEKHQRFLSLVKIYSSGGQLKQETQCLPPPLGALWLTTECYSYIYILIAFVLCLWNCKGHFIESV